MNWRERAVNWFVLLVGLYLIGKILLGVYNG
jgi:hypothetical protein